MAKQAKLLLKAVLIGAVLLFGRDAWAHHAFASTFLSTIVTIDGSVVEFLFRNPHSVVLVKTSGEKGQQPLTWAAEWGSGGQLSRLGIEKDTFKPGDRVTIIGNPSRNSADHRLRILNMARPSDGWKCCGSP